MPDGAVISEFTMLSFRQADLVMAGIPFSNENGESAFVQDFSDVSCGSPDLDVDGIPNHFDTDSDDDMCSDAYEA